MITGPNIIKDGLVVYFDADNLKSYNPSNINDTNLLDIGTWIPGYSIPSPNYFSLNGEVDENNKYIGLDPFGEKTIIWESNGTGDNGADGGWDNAMVYNIDTTKTYRFSTWVHRSILGNGNFYLGFYVNDLGGALLSATRRTNTAVTTTNPYFYFENGATLNDWTLVVGHLWPVGTGQGDNHTDSGRYRIDGGKISSSGFVDYILPNGSYRISHRSYLYYSTIIPTQQRWCYPRIDICDGNEPTINDLLNGIPNQNQYQIKDLSGNGNYINLGNKLNYSNNSFRLDNSTLKPDYITAFVTGDTSLNFSFELVFKRDNTSSRKTFISFQKDNRNSYDILECCIETNDASIILFRGNGSSYQTRSIGFSSQGFSSLNYNLYTFNVSGQTITVYVNGVNIGSWTNESYYDFDKVLLGIRYMGSQGLNGNIKLFKYYNRTLSTTEILQNYNATKSRFGL